MKNLKKIVAISSAVICLGTTMSINTHASNWLEITNDALCEEYCDIGTLTFYTFGSSVLVKSKTGNYANAFGYFSDFMLEEHDVSVLIEYLSENHPKVEVIKGIEGGYTLDLNTNLNQLEKIDFYKSIYDAIGYLPMIVCPEDSQYTLVRLGDLDSDGTVNALDASNILTYYSDYQTGNTDTYTDGDIADITLLGDYDADGAVNALDASLVLKEYAETQTNC